MRQRRFALFESLLETLPEPRRILDVGGTPGFWEARGYAGRPGTEIVMLNVVEFPIEHPNFTSIVGDAADLGRFPDASFEVVFSNSVIEHLETLERQRRMADEVRRVGRRYFVQTPNRSFPLEPHFLFPGFQFLPLDVRVRLLRRFTLGHYARTPDRAAAEHAIRLIRLLSESELRDLFPGGWLWRERVAGLTKSFVVGGGWPEPDAARRPDTDAAPSRGG
jgi:SAM-dependent methyltransferase